MDGHGVDGTTLASVFRSFTVLRHTNGGEEMDTFTIKRMRCA